MNLKLKLLATTIFAGLLVGCGGPATGTVTGRVLIDGAAQGGFEVTFTSQTDGSGAMGSSQQDGQYQLFVGRGKTQIPAGNYKVTVAPTPFVEGIPLPKVKLPATVTDLDQTVLIKTVKGGENVIDLEVTPIR